MEKRSRRKQKSSVLPYAAVALLAILIILMFVWKGCGSSEEVEETTTQAIETTTEMPMETETVAETIAEEEPLVMLDFMAEWREKNSDIVAWLRIDDTVVDYPVVHAPEEKDKYLRLGLDGNYSVAGTLYIKELCSVDVETESDNLIIYGHNMRNGSMFHILLDYAEESFWKEHPEIYFATMYEERTYEVLAAFYDRVYYTHEDVFKYYQFIDPETEEEFQEGIEYFKEHSEYDTGVTAEYGDRLITLVTCSKHRDNGRFVVVAKEKTHEE